MENTMEVSTPTETQVTDPVKPTVPEISLNPQDFQAELAKIAAEQGMKIEGGNAVPIGQVPAQEQTQANEAVPQPILPQAGTQPQVPEKFQTKEGSVDVDKVQKSTINAEQALKRYQEIEAELRRKQNEVNQLRQAPQQQAQPQQQAPYQQIPQITPEQINQALETSKNPGKVILDLLAIRDQAVYSQARSETMAEVEAIKSRVDAGQRQSELQKIVDEDPWVFSQEGIERLAAIRQERPWLNQAPEPWLEAYNIHIASKTRQAKSGSQVSMTTPLAGTAKAPPTPVNAGNRTQSQQASLAQLSQNPAALNKFLDSLPDEKSRKAFWGAVLPGSK